MNTLPFELIELISSFQDNISDVSKLRNTCKQYLRLPLTPRTNDNSLVILMQLFPNQSWSVEILNLSVTWDIVLKYPEYRWDYYYLSFNRHITLDIIEANPNLPWNYNSMSHNPNLTIEFIISRRDKDWNYEYISLNPIITPLIVKNHSDIPWNKSAINQNPNFHVKDLIDLNMFDKHEYRYNSNLSDDDLTLLLNKQLSLNWNSVSKCRNITLDYILSHPEHNWNYQIISERSDVTDIIMEAHPYKDWNKLTILHRCNKEKFGDFVLLQVESGGITISDTITLLGIISSEEILKHFLVMLPKAELEDIFVPELIYRIINNYNISIPTIIKLFEGYKYNNMKVLEDDCVLMYLSQRRDLRWDTVKNNPQIKWSFQLMFKHLIK